MFSFDSGSPLPVSGGETYRGAAFDGCRYYLTVRCGCVAVVLDRDLRLEKRVETRRPYTALCYDPRRGCFWAASDQCRSALFQLDRDLQEIDRLCLDFPGCGLLTSVSFCCGSGLLLLSRGNQLLEADPADGTVRLLREEPESTLILAAACLPPYIFLSVLRGGKACLLLAACDGTVLAEEPAPPAPADALLPVPCCPGPRGYSLLLLANKHGCYPRLFRACLNEEITASLCPCSWELCRTCEEDRPCPAPCACTDILESIALEEAAIAHILNAEGEKLQKAAASAAPCELLSVNASVQRTIRSVTQLEQVLLSKLESLREICCPCGPQAPPCPSSDDALSAL